MNDGIEKGQVMGIWRNVYRRLVDPSDPEWQEFLEYSDWMGIPIQPYPITLDRLKGLLMEQASALRN